jgi:hypothetical protein
MEGVMKSKWTKETAERCVSEKIATGKVILLDGNLSLKQCGAADYLVKNHGYIFKHGGN